MVVTCGNNPEVKAWLLEYTRSELFVVCVCVRLVPPSKVPCPLVRCPQTNTCSPSKL